MRSCQWSSCFYIRRILQIFHFQWQIMVYYIYAPLFCCLKRREKRKMAAWAKVVYQVSLRSHISSWAEKKLYIKFRYWHELELDLLSQIIAVNWSWSNSGRGTNGKQQPLLYLSKLIKFAIKKGSEWKWTNKSKLSFRF